MVSITMWDIICWRMPDCVAVPEPTHPGPACSHAAFPSPAQPRLLSDLPWVGIAVGLLLMIPLRLPWLLWPLWGLCFSELWRLLGQGFLQRWLPNRELPRLHITALKESQRTLVVLPTLPTPEQAVHMIGRLSELCHADPDPNIEYMLLGNFADSLTAEQVSDDLILRAASSALEALQESDPEHRYLYLQRRRTYDKGEGAWIGRERRTAATWKV